MQISDSNNLCVFSPPFLTYMSLHSNVIVIKHQTICSFLIACLLLEVSVWLNFKATHVKIIFCQVFAQPVLLMYFPRPSLETVCHLVDYERAAAIIMSQSKSSSKLLQWERVGATNRQACILSVTVVQKGETSQEKNTYNQTLHMKSEHSNISVLKGLHININNSLFSQDVYQVY